MKGKRTVIDWGKHEVTVTKQDGLLVHHLKDPDTVINNIKYINTNGILAVTGDYGNWMFCREFHPSANGFVSEGYWKEKLRNLSTQEPNDFDEDATRKELEGYLADTDEPLREIEKDYIEGCLDAMGDGEFDYSHYAYRNNVGRFIDGEYVPFCKKTKYWLDAVFDGFDEICRRMKEEAEKPEQFTLFYDGVFSNWYIAPFKDAEKLDEKANVFNCVEQYMMYNKALVFCDFETASKIMQTSSPRRQKELGREVKGFDKETWDKISQGVVYAGNYFKFSQNPDLKEKLMATKGTTLVECSLDDKFWGIGFYEHSPECRDRSKWLGTNWLGETLTQLRKDFENNTTLINT